jgi:hypothetical protein
MLRYFLLDYVGKIAFFNDHITVCESVALVVVPLITSRIILGMVDVDWNCLFLSSQKIETSRECCF